ncbi:hypothetical protein ACIA58_15045 [Kribbella sp. NPDC051586]|uniref:hypothetical protein n=1 Tax=Kribbella sp. NPDC051586 TaxID=3364118 RepID=UPI0037A67A26
MGGGMVGLLAGLVVGTAGGSNATDAAPQPAVTVTLPAARPSPEPVITPTNKPAQAAAPKTAAPESTGPKSAAPETAAPKTPPKPAGVACAGQEDKNAPCVVTVGKPFQLGKHTVLSGWKLTSEYGSASMTGKARNTGGETSSMFIELKFLKADEVVIDVQCSTNQLEPGQTQAMSCFSSDDYTKKYDRVTAEAMF